MTLPADLEPQRGVVVSLSASRRRPLAQASIVPIGEGIAGIMFDMGGDAGPQPSAAMRLSAFLDGEPVRGPMISTRLDLRGGGERHLLLLRRPAHALADRRIELLLGGQPAAAIDPTWLQSPLCDGADAIEGLSDRGRRRLLRLFLTTGISLFGLEGAAEFSSAATRLMDLLGLRAIAPAAWSPLGSGGRIVSYRMAAAIDPRLVGELVSLSAGSVVRAPGCQLIAETRGDACLLHVFMRRPPLAGAALVGLGENPVHLSGPEAGQAPQPLHSWLERRDDATRRWACGLVEAEAPRDPAAAALLRELRHGGGAEPGVTLRHLSGTAEGLLYAMELADPHRLIRAIRFERGEAAVELDLAAQARPQDTPVIGFARLPRGSWIDDACRIRLAYHSGRLRTVHEGRPDVFSGRTPRSFAWAAAADAVEALAAARLTMDRPDAAAFVEDFGAAQARPELSIVAPVGADLDLIRVRAAKLFAEGGAGVELVYHAAAGARAAAARGAIADAAAVYGAPHRLVTFGKSSDPASRMLAALDAARGTAALLLGSEVLPMGRGWLEQWRRAMGRGDAIVGGTLLGIDGAVVDAGACGSGRNDARRAKGLPGSGLPRAEFAATSRVTADCVGLTRPVIDALLGSAIWHPEPDLLLAQAVARQRKGAVRTLLRGRFVRYGAEPVRDPLTLAADARALAAILKRSFSVVGEEG